MSKQSHFYLKSHCCVCSKYNNLLDINAYDYDKVTFKSKLCISFPDLECNSNNNEIPSYICVVCAENLNHVYKFRVAFLHTRKYTLGYLKELKNVPNNKYNKLQVDLVDLKDLIPKDISQISEMSYILEDSIDIKEEPLEDHQYLNIYKEFALEDRPSKLTEVGTNFLGFKRTTTQCKTCKGLKKYNKPRLNCKICSKSYRSDSWLKKHQLAHQLPKKVKCKICHKDILAKMMPKHQKIHQTHQKTHEMEECYSCCSQILIGDHHVCKPVEKCVKCNHVLEDEDKHICKSFKCVLCPKEFKSKRNLTKHIKRHLNVKRFKCGFCGDKFDKRELLKDHIIMEHSF